MNTPDSALAKNAGYSVWLRELKTKIRSTQLRAALAASRELILFYWELGEEISRKLKETNWGAKVMDQLAKDLRSEFPDMQGFSRRNLYYTKKFYEVFCGFAEEEQIVPRSEAQFEKRPQSEDENPFVRLTLKDQKPEDATLGFHFDLSKKKKG